MEEESSWNYICDQIQSDIRWLEAYLSILDSIDFALTACLDAHSPAELDKLTTMQKAFLFQSFFDNKFLSHVQMPEIVGLQELYVSPLGKTFLRSQLEPPAPTALREPSANNMDFKAVISDTPQPIGLSQLVDIVKDKELEFTTTFILRNPEDLFSVCMHCFKTMVLTNSKIVKCKNCGKYFVPVNRSDEQYCNRIQANGKTCKEQGYSTKIRGDRLRSIYRTAYKTHNDP